MYFCWIYLEVWKFLLSFAAKSSCFCLNWFNDIMRKKSFVRTELFFRDVYCNVYREAFLCSSFLSLEQILDLSDSMLANLPDNRIDWASMKIKMLFVNLSCFSLPSPHYAF